VRGLVVLTDTLSLFAVLQLLKHLPSDRRGPGPQPFFVIVSPRRCARLDRSPGHHERSSRGHRPGSDRGPVIRVEHGLT
jgi:hypothetical protein